MKLFGSQKKGNMMFANIIQYVCNKYDMLAIKSCLTDENGKEQIVGHLPLELSQFKKCLLDRGTVVISKLSSTRYRRSVLVQRGLEIPCQVKAEIIATEKNKCILARYLNLLNQNYKRPSS